jgi:hypothetical protein
MPKSPRHHRTRAVPESATPSSSPSPQGYIVYFSIIFGLQILILICYIAALLWYATLLLFCCIVLMCYIATLLWYSTLPLTCHIALICYITTLFWYATFLLICCITLICYIALPELTQTWVHPNVYMLHAFRGRNLCSVILLDTCCYLHQGP